MQRPPDRRSPPILFGRPTHEWISRVDQRLKQLSAIELSAEAKDRLRGWTEVEFTDSTLQLGGVAVSRQEIARLVSMPSLAGEASIGADSIIIRLIESLRVVESLAREEGRKASLTPDLLIRIHNASDDSLGFRASGGVASRGHQPVLAEHLPAAVDAACRWFSAESFDELHPVEQGAIVFLRLIEIQPFEEGHERTALLAASLFTLRRELPPVIVTPAMEPAYRNAIDEGFRMNTKPMVELVAEAVSRTLDQLLAIAA
ncbi:MAG TPA: Fic family protein [Blastocatellia bacterium]|nr:Fic family protein [Blastocatellia bacterium]